MVKLYSTRNLGELIFLRASAFRSPSSIHGHFPDLVNMVQRAKCKLCKHLMVPHTKDYLDGGDWVKVVQTQVAEKSCS